MEPLVASGKPIAALEEAAAVADDTEANHATGHHQPTAARWWVLLVFCLLGACQACTWNIFSPIFPATYKAFPSWSSSYLYWLINSANIAFLFTLVPVSHAIHSCGMRRSGAAAAVLVVSAGLHPLLPVRWAAALTPFARFRCRRAQGHALLQRHGCSVHVTALRPRLRRRRAALATRSRNGMQRDGRRLPQLRRPSAE